MEWDKFNEVDVCNATRMTLAMAHSVFTSQQVICRMEPTLYEWRMVRDSMKWTCDVISMWTSRHLY
eukprot:272584-Amphidinium_carterae.3